MLPRSPVCMSFFIPGTPQFTVILLYINSETSGLQRKAGKELPKGFLSSQPASSELFGRRSKGRRPGVKLRVLSLPFSSWPLFRGGGERFLLESRDSAAGQSSGRGSQKAGRREAALLSPSPPARLQQRQESLMNTN